MLAFFVFLNVFQTRQYQKGLINGTGMTKKSYWTIFLRAKDRYGYWQNLTEPDAEIARKGIYIFHPVIWDTELWKEMPEEDARYLISKELSMDNRLPRDISRYCRRTGAEREETLDMLVDRIYQRRIGK